MLGSMLALLLVWLWSSLVFRVWDKVISGSCKILVFVALEILLSYKIILMGINRPEGMVKFLCNVSIRDTCVSQYGSNNTWMLINNKHSSLGFWVSTVNQMQIQQLQLAGFVGFFLMI